jgi:hypothetical protein
VSGARFRCSRLASLHGRWRSRELLSHGCHFHRDPQHLGDCGLPALLLRFFFRLPLGLDCLCYPARLGFLCYSPSFHLPCPLPGFGLGKSSRLGLFLFAPSVGFRLGPTPRLGFRFRDPPRLGFRRPESSRCFRCLAAGLRRRDAALFFFLRLSSRFLLRRNAPRFRFCRASRFRLLGPAASLRLCCLTLGLGLGGTSAFRFLVGLAFSLGFGLRRLPPCLRFGRAAALRLFGGPATSFRSCSTHRFCFCGASLLQLGRLTSLFLARRPTLGRLPGPLLLRLCPGRIGFGLPRRPLRA